MKNSRNSRRNPAISDAKPAMLYTIPAGVIVGLVKVEDKYPEWRKNSDVMKRLWFDIESVLDEMNYARAVPRGALVAEIIKAARGRINRHRL